MRVTGQLKEPVLDPCPNRDDLQTLVNPECEPVQCTRPQGGPQPGTDCCQFWTGPDQWQKSSVRVDHLDPEKFKYDQYRYQLYAKPTNFDCRNGVARQGVVPDRHYEPPVTDIRALRQTTVVPIMRGAGAGGGIPVVPTNPGGVSEVTFPMTQATLGQPDVTTACCIPVVPCQQGFQNLTPSVRQVPGARCTQPPPPGRALEQLGPRRPDPCTDVADCDRKQQQRAGINPAQRYGQTCGPAPQQYVMPPSNQQGSCCGGLPPVFPQSGSAYGAPNVPELNLPRPQFQGNGQQGECFDTDAYCDLTGIEDGMNPKGGPDTGCTNVSTFRYQDRVWREYNTVKETTQERRERLTRMSGAYGAALQPKNSSKRALCGPKDNITVQGNGFAWGGYPKNENKMCYVLERNHRC